LDLAGQGKMRKANPQLLVVRYIQISRLTLSDNLGRTIRGCVGAFERAVSSTKCKKGSVMLPKVKGIWHEQLHRTFESK
jgi:hypothetical protein